MARIGVLALQGDFAAHARVLGGLGQDVVEVRHCTDLESLAGLVLPGGESTALLRLMGDEPWFDGLRALHGRGGAMLATCAGAIVLARRVVGPEQPSVGLLDVVVRRNAYGRQADSFEADLALPGAGSPMRAVFIRAPRFEQLGAEVERLAEHGGDPVLVRQGSILAATFHPELSGDDRLHRRLLELLPPTRVERARQLQGV
jgi:5'-phosphate synthase pdxT subunit